MDLSQEIINALQEKPGHKTRELALKLRVDRSAVHSVLYSDLRGMVYQDDQAPQQSLLLRFYSGFSLSKPDTQY